MEHEKIVTNFFLSNCLLKNMQSRYLHFDLKQSKQNASKNVYS